MKFQVNKAEGGSPIIFHDWFTWRRFLIFYTALFVITFHEVLISGKSFFIRDFGTFGYPVAFFHRECFWNGGIPLWNPYNNCGIPFLAQWNTLTFYPGSLIYLLLPMPWSVSFFGLVHLFAGGVGMYLLIARWKQNSFAAAFAALAFSCNGLALNCLMWQANLAALSLMPWTVLLIQRAWQEGGRVQVTAIVVAASQMLTGAPEIILFTWGILFCLWVSEFYGSESLRRSLLLRRLAMAVVLVAALSAVQLLPFFDLIHYSHRSEAFADENGSMPRWGLLNLLFPLFHFFPTDLGVFFQPNQFWTTSYYPGIIAVALASLAVCFRRRKLNLLLISVVVLLVLAMGKGGLVYQGLRFIFPPLGFFRFPIKFVVPAIFGIIVATAFVLAELRTASDSLWKQLLRASGFIFFVILGLALLTAWLSQRHPVGHENWIQVATNNGMRLVALFLFSTFIVLLCRGGSGQRQIIMAIVALAIVWVDGISHVPWQNPTVNPEFMKADLAAAQFDQPLRSGFSRLMLSRTMRRFLFNTTFDNPEQDVRMRRLLFSNNYNLLDHIPKLDGFYSLYPANYWEFYKQFDQTNAPVSKAALDFLGVAEISKDTNAIVWLSRSNFMPMISIGQRPVFTNDVGALNGVLSPGFDPRKTVFLPAEARNLVSDNQVSKANVHDVRFGIQEMEFMVEAAEPAVAVVSQTFFHCWKAYIDGNETTVLKANYAFQAIPVAAGKHHVMLVYEDKAFKIGAVISLLAALFCFGWLAKLWPRADS